jgi:hypothetical protein
MRVEPPRVCAVNDSHTVKQILLRHLGALDSCDKHRNDGGEVGETRETPWRKPDGKPHPEHLQPVQQMLGTGPG